MPPIPVHIDDPITPTKAQGVTPQTAAVAGSDDGTVRAGAPPSVPATTTAVAAPFGYPAARPGASAVPAPTPFLLSPQQQPAPTRTAAEDNGPPPPQPGAVPTPYSQPTATARQGSAFTGALNNMYTPPPPQQIQTNYAPTHSTSTTAGQALTPQRAGPTTLNMGPVASPFAGGYQDTGRRVSSERPQGYVQNVYAQELSPAQRASLEQEERRESFVDKLGFGGLGGGDGSLAGERRVSEQVGGAWDAAKGWLSKAGTTIAEGEQEIWRRVNGGR